MPWKDNYTTSDERSLADRDIAWPDGKRCCLSITVDLSLASQAEGITEQDLRTDRAVFGMNEGLDATIALLDDFGLKATFATPAVLASTYAERLREVQAAGHEVAVHGFKHEDVATLSRDEEAARMDTVGDILDFLATPA